MANKPATSTDIMKQVANMYSEGGEWDKLYQTLKGTTMADVTSRLVGAGLGSTTRPAAASVGYDIQAGPGFAVQKLGAKAGALTGLAQMMEQIRQFNEQKKFGYTGIGAQLQQAQMGAAGQMAATGMQVASQQGMNAADIASRERMGQLSAQTALQVAGMQYPTKDTSNLSTYQTEYRSIINPTPTQKLTQPTTSAYGPLLNQPPKVGATGYQAYQNVMSNMGLGEW